MEPMKPMAPMTPMEPMTPMKPMAPQEQWWPDGLGEPNATGSQNELQYAYFGASRRLAVMTGKKTLVYDTGNHRIEGASQWRKNEDGGATFTSQDGDIRLADLKVVGE